MKILALNGKHSINYWWVHPQVVTGEELGVSDYMSTYSCVAKKNHSVEGAIWR